MSSSTLDEGSSIGSKQRLEEKTAITLVSEKLRVIKNVSGEWKDFETTICRGFSAFETDLNDFSLPFPSTFPLFTFSSTRSGKATMRSLTITSHRLNSIWTPISIQNVTLWLYQLPSFLRLLLKRPELGSNVRSLNFVTIKGTEMEDARETVIELLTMRHSRITEPERELNHHSIQRILGEARALIVEHCTELRVLSLDSEMALPLSLSGPPKSIFSERLTSIKTVDFSTDPNDTRSLWTGRQALTLLIFLPSLQSASLVFGFSFQDASVINTHLPSLIESGRAVSNVKTLSLKFYLQFPRYDRQFFNHDSTLITLLSIFNRLENISLTFIEDPVSSPQSLQSPTSDLIKGLTDSSETLRSLSVDGQSLGQSSEKDARDERFWSFLRRFKQLDHLRIDATAFFGAVASQDGFYKGPDIKSLELANNYTDWGVEESGGNAELFLWTMLEGGQLPKSLKLIRSPRRLLGPLNQSSPVPPADLEAGDQFYKAREEFLEAAEKSGVMVEFYD